MRGFLVLSLIAAMVPAAARAAPSGPLPLLPMPASVEVGAGRFVVAGAAISVTDDGGKEAGSRLRDLVARSGGPALSFSARGAIRFRRDAGIKGAEAYRLVVTPAGATISAASVTNTTGTARTVTAYVTPSGGSAYVVWSGSVPANQTVIMNGLIAQTLDAADATTVKADAGSAVDVDISGYQTVP